MISRCFVMRVVHVILPCLLALACTAPAWSQDLVTVAPDAAKVEYEDARIRVVRLRIAANASLPMHDGPARVVIPLTPNEVRISNADGTMTATRTDAHRVAWSEPAPRAVTNLANARLENIIVELKTASAPAEAAHPPVPPPPEYLADARHGWLFENQYVRVYNVRIRPGETTDFHRHAYDAVSVFVSGGLVAIQPQGGPWGKTERVVPGVTFSADSKKPSVHRVRNDGRTEYHVVLVQLLR
jgi:quercetin dioxygenase-like cupin family protein